MAVYGLTKRSRGVKPMVVVNPSSRRPRRRVQSKQVVVVAAPTTGRRRRGRRGRGKRNPRTAGGSGNGIVRQQFTFSKDSIKGNSSGSITFGKDLSEHTAFSKGVLTSYHEYKITNVRVHYKSEAPSTAAGAIAYELDPHCKQTELKSRIFKFGITDRVLKTTLVTWSAGQINGKEWHSFEDNQFRLLYSGNGADQIAGSFEIVYTVLSQGPK
nr:coat protein [Carrot polerovirus 2]